MKRLIVGLALLALMLPAPYVVAAGGGTNSQLQEAWKRVQAQQQRFETEMSRVDMEAARIVEGSSILKKKRAVPCQPIRKDQIRLCMKCAE
jgi:hypothetical protein